MKFRVFSLVVLTATLWAGCSGSGLNRVPGQQCPSDYNPIDLNPKANQKLWGKGDNKDLPAGNYVYLGSDMIYKEKGDGGMVVHVKDDAQGKASTLCVRNAGNLTERNLSGSTQLVSKIVSEAGKAPTVSGRQLSFRVVDRRLTAESKDLSADDDSFDKVYSAKADDFFMMQPQGNVYEIRSKYSDNKADYSVSVKLQKK